MYTSGGNEAMISMIGCYGNCVIVICRSPKSHKLVHRDNLTCWVSMRKFIICK